MRIADALGWQQLLAELANIQGMNHLITRQFEQAEPLFSQAAQLWAEEGVPQEQGRSLINLAQVYFDTGDTKRAKEAVISSSDGQCNLPFSATFSLAA